MSDLSFEALISAEKRHDIAVRAIRAAASNAFKAQSLIDDAAPPETHAQARERSVHFVRAA